MLVLLLILFICPSSFLISQDTNKKVLAIEDYMRWRSIFSTAISDDGNWVSFSNSFRNDSDTLYVQHLSTDRIFEIPRDSRPQFSDNN